MSDISKAQDQRRTPVASQARAGLYESSLGYSAGEIVSNDRAQKLDTVWACLKLRGEDFGSLPWRLFRDVGGARRQAPLNHPAWNIVRSPNWVLGAPTLKEMIARHSDASGNFYAEIESDPVTGLPIALWPLDPETVTILVDETTSRPVYRVNQNAQEVFLSMFNTFHIKGPTDNGYIGRSAIAWGAMAIGGGLAQERASNGYFEKGMQNDKYWSVPEILDEEVRAELEKTLEEAYTPNQRSGIIPVLHGDVTLKSITNDPVTSQLLETRQFNVEQICRLFRVPLHKIFRMESMTFSNMEQLNTDYHASMIPLATKVEHEFNEKILKRFDPTRKALSLDIDLAGLARADSETRAEIARKQFDMGALSINEVRQELNPNLGPVDNGEARYIQSSMMRVDIEEEAVDPLEIMRTTAEEEIEGRERGSIGKMLNKEDLDARLVKFIDRHFDYVCKKLGPVCIAHGVPLDENKVQEYCLSLCKKVNESKVYEASLLKRLIEEMFNV